MILFVPNLSGTGHLLVVEGLNVAGTEAAAELLFHPELISSVLDRAKRPDDNLRSFEVLLRTIGSQSNAEGTEVVASRVRDLFRTVGVGGRCSDVECAAGREGGS